jgi:hypothetical protein
MPLEGGMTSGVKVEMHPNDETDFLLLSLLDHLLACFDTLSQRQGLLYGENPDFNYLEQLPILLESILLENLSRNPFFTSLWHLYRNSFYTLLKV